MPNAESLLSRTLWIHIARQLDRSAPKPSERFSSRVIAPISVCSPLQRSGGIHAA